MLTDFEMLLDWFLVRVTGAPAQRGATMVEYALIVALISIAAIVVIGAIGGELTSVFTSVKNELTGATGTSGGGGSSG